LTGKLTQVSTTPEESNAHNVNLCRLDNKVTTALKRVGFLFAAV